jgi:hypothetical protein
MAAITMNTAAVDADGIQFLESVAILNQTAASTAVKKGIAVPSWAKSVQFTIFMDVVGGTTPKFDFVLGQPDWGTALLLAAPTDDTDILTLGNTPWDGITQVTAAGPSQIVIWVGPDVTTDDTGSATASCEYAVKAPLPPVITYTYTTQDAADDADYTFRLVAKWLRG